MPLRRSGFVLNLGSAETWISGLANESRTASGDLKYDATFDAVAPLPLNLHSQSPLQRERELENALVPLLPTTEPPEARTLPLDVEVCVSVAESPWMPQAALRITRQWTNRLDRPDARCMVWNIRTDKEPSYGCGVLCWNGQLILNLSGFALEFLIDGPEQGVMNSCPVRTAPDGVIELVLEPGFWNDVTVALFNATTRNEHIRSISMFLPASNDRLNTEQMQRISAELLSRVYRLCFGVLGRSCPGSAMTVWNH